MAKSLIMKSNLEEAVAKFDSNIKDLYSRVHCLEQSNGTKDELISNLQDKNAELEDKLSKVEDLSDKMATLDLTITGLAKKQKSLSKDISKKTENQSEQDFDGFKRISRQQEAWLSEMDRKMTSLSAKVDRLRTLQRILNQIKVSTLDRENITKEVNSSKQDIRALKEKIDGTAGNVPVFSMARYEKDPIELPNVGVKYNISDFTDIFVASHHFVKETGTFTAPVQGVYGFYVELWKVGEGCIRFGVGHQDSFYNTSLSKGNTLDRNATHLLWLAENEQVVFQARRENGSAKVGGYWIAGWLVRKD